MRSIVLAAVLAFWAGAAHASPTLVDFATISMSAPGVPRTVTDTVCVTDGNDLACDRGVYITSNSRVGIRTNNPSTSIHLNAASESDGIMFSNGSEPQFWLMGKRPGNYSAGPAPHLLYYAFFNGSDWVQPLNLHSDGTVGIRRSNPSTTLDVAGSLRLWQEASTTLGVCDSNRTGAIRFTGGDFSFCRNGSAWETLASVANGALSDRIVSGTSSVIVNSATSTISFTFGGITSGYIGGSPGYMALNISGTTYLRAVSGNYGLMDRNDGSYYYQLITNSGDQYGSWNSLRPMMVNLASGTVSFANHALQAFTNNKIAVGHGTMIASTATVLPSTTLDVSGSIRFTTEASGGGYDTCTTNRRGAVKYEGGDFSFCRNGSAWETLTSLGGGGGLSDRITSGTSAVVVNSTTGIVSISQLGAVASYVHPNLGYVGPGVSATGTVSASKVATNEMLLSKNGGPCSTLADEGRMFRNPTSGRLQVCAVRY